MRVEWSDGFTDEDRYRSRLHEVSDETVHFLRVAGDLLVSHVQVIPIEVHGRDRDLTLGGVSGVLTYPQFRGEGHATALLHAAAGHINRQGFDLGMLFCGPEMIPFYERLGWRALPEGRVLVGSADLHEDLVMVLGDDGPARRARSGVELVMPAARDGLSRNARAPLPTALRRRPGVAGSCRDRRAP